ncbi:DMT family transporter [Thermodesulfobacteriota bacterium]
MDVTKRKNTPPVNPHFALAIGVFAVSTGAIFARLAEAPALVIAAYRVGLATLILAPVTWITAKDELLALSKTDLSLAATSGFFLALHFAAWISSLNYTSVANSVVLVNTNPLWVGLLSPLIAKERIRKAAVLSIIVSVIGGFVIGAGDFKSDVNALRGDALALFGSIGAAVYILIGRNLRRRLTLLVYVMVCYGSAAIILWACVLVFQMKISGFDKTTWIFLGAMALITQMIGHTSYNWALKWFSAGLIAVSLLGEPICATMLAYMIFDEGLTWSKIIGGALVLSAIYIAGKSEKHEKRIAYTHKHITMIS